jgi:hypothetical protein
MHTTAAKEQTWTGFKTTVEDCSTITSSTANDSAKLGPWPLDSYNRIRRCSVCNVGSGQQRAAAGAAAATLAPSSTRSVMTHEEYFMLLLETDMARHRPEERSTTLKNAVFWNVTSFGSCTNRRIGERITSIKRVKRIRDLGALLQILCKIPLFLYYFLYIIIYDAIYFGCRLKLELYTNNFPGTRSKGYIWGYKDQKQEKVEVPCVKPG